MLDRQVTCAVAEADRTKPSQYQRLRPEIGPPASGSRLSALKPSISLALNMPSSISNPGSSATFGGFGHFAELSLSDTRHGDQRSAVNFDFDIGMLGAANRTKATTDE